MKINKASSKMFIVLTNPTRMKRAKESMGEFEILLSNAKDKMAPIKSATLSRTKENEHPEPVKEEVSNHSLIETKGMVSSALSGVEKNESKNLPNEDQVGDQKFVKKSQRTHERRLRDDIGLADPVQFSNLARVERGVPQRSPSKLGDALKSNVPRYSESSPKTIGDSTPPVPDHQFRDLVFQHSRDVHRSSINESVEIAQDKTVQDKEEEDEKARVTVNEKVSVSNEEVAHLKLRSVETRKVLSKDIPSEFSSEIVTPITHEIDETKELATMREEPVVRAQTLTTAPKEDKETPLSEVGSEQVEVSESSVNGSNHVFVMKDGSTYTLKNGREEALKEITQARILVEKPSIHEEIYLVVREEVPFKAQVLKDRVRTVLDEKESAFEVPIRTQGEVERRTGENILAENVDGEPVVKSEVSLHTPSESQHLVSEEEVTNRREMETSLAFPEQFLNTTRVSEDFQETKSAIREAEVFIFYDKRERLESFREVFDENLSELVHRSRAQEAYILQGSTRNEETVPVHSVSRIVERMFIQREERAVMTLNPPELGRVEVVIEKSGEEVRVTLKVYTEEAKDALEKEVPQLVDRLSERGLDVRVQIEKQEERDLLQEEDRRERRQRERRSNRFEREDFSETMKEVVG